MTDHGLLALCQSLCDVLASPVRAYQPCGTPPDVADGCYQIYLERDRLRRSPFRLGINAAERAARAAWLAEKLRERGLVPAGEGCEEVARLADDGCPHIYEEA